MKNFCFTLLILLFCHQLTFAQEEQAAATTDTSRKGKPHHSAPLPLEEIRTFSEIFTVIKRSYVEQIDDATLLENAVRGMLERLDPHSIYLDGSEFEAIREGSTGEFGGLGMEVTMEDGMLKVITPIDDTPAQRAGIRAGDIIIRLDGKPTKRMSLDETITLMRGKPDTQVILTIVRDKGEPFNVELTRAIITVKSVKGRLLEPGYAYVRITRFQNHTPRNLVRMLEKLAGEEEQKLQGIILDLRNNPGGVLDAAVGVSDLFLDDGLIVYTKGRGGDQTDMEYYSNPADMLSEVSIVVLVNEGSASASEIVAGALQDHNRAVIVGKKTFGKGSVQTVLPLNEDTALKLTTARYYTPSGRSIQAEGIIPDISITDISFASAREAENIAAIRENDLNRRLPNQTDTDDVATDEAGDADNDEDQFSRVSEREDYQLYEAFNILKAIHIQKEMTQASE